MAGKSISNLAKNNEHDNNWVTYGTRQWAIN